MNTRSHIDHYEIIQTLGKGSFAVVKLAQNSQSNAKVALKLMKPTSPDLTAKFQSILQHEVAIQRSLSHPNIALVFDASTGSVFYSKKGTSCPALYIAMELCSGGELYDFLAISGRFSEPQLRTLLLQLLSALEYAHTAGVAHRDLKPENLLLDSEFQLKLCDFGYAVEIFNSSGERKTLTDIAGSEGYAAPEILEGRSYDGVQADIFSLGVILYNLLCFSRPFKKADTTQGLYKTFVANNTLFWEERRRKGIAPVPEFINLINQMLALDPATRPSIAQIRTHPWTIGQRLSDEEMKANLRERYERVNEEREKKRQENRKRKTVVNTGNRFRDLQVDSSSSGSGSSGTCCRELRTLAKFQPVRNTFYRLYVSCTAEDAAYTIRALLNSRLGYTFEEDSGKYRFSVCYTDDEDDILKVKIEFFDGEDTLVLETTKVSGCIFTYFSFFRLLKAEFDH